MMHRPNGGVVCKASILWDWGAKNIVEFFTGAFFG
jgi:hypothetical protein